MAAVEPGWSVEKIKRMGADAVKLLAQFEPTEPISAEHQFQVVEHVYNECKKFDILLLLETVSFPFGGEKKTDASYLDRKARTVIESARQLSRFCDIYKSEFPGTLGHESDEQLENNLHALDAASERPGCCSRRASISRTICGRSSWRWPLVPRGYSAAGPSGRSTSSRQGSEARSRSPRRPRDSGWPKSMPWFARKERPGLPATVSARMSWPRSGPPRAGTRGTGHAGRLRAVSSTAAAAPGEVY